MTLVCQDHGDTRPDSFDINCTDPLGRTALSIAIINENPELIEILLESGIQTRDSLLLAIDEQYVEGWQISGEKPLHQPDVLQVLSYCWSMKRGSGAETLHTHGRQ